MTYVLRQIELDPDENGEYQIPEGWEPVAAERFEGSKVLAVIVQKEDANGRSLVYMHKNEDLHSD